MASDVWDTVTSKEFREKALAIGGTILVAAAAATAVIATAGAAGPAMGAVVTYLGGSAAMAGAATTATTVGGYVIAGAVVADAVNTSAEVVTGTNYIAKKSYELFGNENWTEQDFLNLYGEGKDLLYMGAYGYAEFGANSMAAGYSSQKSKGDSGHRYLVDSAMSSDDKAAGVLRNGVYVKNPTAHNINDYIREGSNYLGSKNMNGKYMYVVDMDGNIIIGTRGGQRMPHPTLVGGSNPQVQAAGMIEIRGGKIYSINNASGHFKPSVDSLRVAEDIFSNLPKSTFSKDFQGYLPHGE